VLLVQELKTADYPRRVAYCNWFLNHMNDNRTLDLSFFSDEAWFHLSGYVFFFFLPFPFHLTGLSGTFYGRLGFFFPLWCGGAPGYFPRLPTPTLSPLLFLDDTTRISQHTTSMGGHPAWDLNPADLAVVSGECRSSFHHPTVSPY
jgi:hypothetical protein